MTDTEITNILQRSLSIDVNIAENGLKCPICGKGIKITKTYFINGVEQESNKKMLICENQINSHLYEYEDYLIFLLDMYEAKTNFVQGEDTTIE